VSVALAKVSAGTVGIRMMMRQSVAFNSVTYNSPYLTGGLLVRVKSGHGPSLPTCAPQQVGNYLGYTGRGASLLAEAAPDPKKTSRGYRR
jgi:hypothetical protein